jgi:hypothetical protein
MRNLLLPNYCEKIYKQTSIEDFNRECISIVEPEPHVNAFVGAGAVIRCGSVRMCMISRVLERFMFSVWSMLKFLVCYVLILSVMFYIWSMLKILIMLALSSLSGSGSGTGYRRKSNADTGPYLKHRM